MTKKRTLVAIPLTALAGAVALALLLGGHPGGTDESPAKAGSTAGGSVADDVGPEPATEPAAGQTTGQTTGTVADEATSGSRQAAVQPLDRAVISTGQVTLHTRQLARARAEVVRLVGSWGGVVADEQSTSDDRGRLRDSTMTLRVPSSRFEDAMTAFDSLGEVEQRSRTSEDVTTRVIDNDARVRAAEQSIRQIERLLSRAEKLGDIIAIESDLARRQADLDSLKSQQAWLKDQTAMSTINLYLRRPVAAVTTQEARGFLAGLEHGWDALAGAAVLALTALGAVLPFAVLLVVLGLPVWLVVRRRRLLSPPADA